MQVEATTKLQKLPVIFESFESLTPEGKKSLIYFKTRIHVVLLPNHTYCLALFAKQKWGKKPTKQKNPRNEVWIT